jgi:hypothetical protein
VQLHPSSTLAKFGSPSEFVLFNHYVSTDLAYIRDCSRIEGKWLLQIAPHFYTSQDARGSRVIRQQQQQDQSSSYRGSSIEGTTTDMSSSSSSSLYGLGGGSNEYDLSVSTSESAKMSEVLSRIESSHGSLLTTSSKLAIPEDSSTIGRPVFTKPVFKKPLPKPNKNEKDKKKRRF